MAQTLRIDFISDVVCPWCVVGLGTLQLALERLGKDVQAEIVLHPFELNPDMPTEGQNVAEHVQMKYGSSPERSAAVRQALRQHGDAVGFTFNYGDDSSIWNTFDAHRLLHWAALEDKQLALKQALFKANFTDQKPMNDHAVLAEAAREAGLDPARAHEILTSDEYAAEVRAVENHWRANGINAVPSVILNQRWLIQGAQPAEVFEQAIRDIVSGKAKEA